jgi:hypothetical protein
MRQQYSLLSQQAGFEPRLLLTTESARRLLPDPDRGGFNAIEVMEPAPLDTGHFPRLRRWADAAGQHSRVIRWLQRVLGNERVAQALPIGLARMLTAVSSMRLSRRALQAKFDEWQPDIILIPGDRELGLLPALLRVAQDRGIPTLLSAVGAAPSGPEGQVAVRRGKPRFAAAMADFPPLLNLFARWLRPGQICQLDNTTMLFSPGWLVFALAINGTLSDHPWIQGGGKSTAIMLENTKRRAAFIRQGVRESKIALTGLLSHDTLAAAVAERADRRRHLADRFGFDPAAPLCVFAVPSYPEQNLMGWLPHRDALTAVLSTLYRLGIPTLLSLHPKSKRQDYDFMEKFENCRFSEDSSVFDLIPISDLFISGNSTTIDTAVACGIPVLNLDYVGLNYPFWADYPAVLTTGDAAAAQALLERVFCVTGEREKLSALQRESGRALANLDGRAGERFMEILTSLATGGTVSDTAPKTLSAAARRT